MARPKKQSNGSSEVQKPLSLRERAAEIERKYEAQKQAELAALNATILKEHFKTIAEQINGGKDEVLKGYWKEFSRAYKAAGDGTSTGLGGGRMSPGGKGRTRLNAEALKGIGEQVVALLKTHKDGLTAAELAAQVDLGGRSPSDLAKRAGAKVVASGRGPGATYTLK